VSDERKIRTYVLFTSSFRYEQAPSISHETVDGVKTLCGRKVADAATLEPDDNDLDPDCITCRKIARKRAADCESQAHPVAAAPHDAVR
jgi:hypothetical protein